VAQNIGSFALSPSAARAIVEARGNIFTVPTEHGSIRDLSTTLPAFMNSILRGRRTENPLRFFPIRPASMSCTRARRWAAKRRASLPMAAFIATAQHGRRQQEAFVLGQNQ